MAITTAQLNAGKALVLDRLFVRYPQCRVQAVLIAIQAYKQGNATQKEVGRALLQQAYEAINGESADLNAGTRHRFKHWLSDLIAPDNDDPTSGVDQSDAFEGAAVTVT